MKNLLEDSCKTNVTTVEILHSFLKYFETISFSSIFFLDNIETDESKIIVISDSRHTRNDLTMYPSDKKTIWIRLIKRFKRIDDWIPTQLNIPSIMFSYTHPHLVGHIHSKLELFL
jgi:hypothetical protein